MALKVLEFILCKTFSGKKKYYFFHIIPSSPLMCYFANTSWRMHTSFLHLL